MHVTHYYLIQPHPHFLDGNSARKDGKKKGKKGKKATDDDEVNLQEELFAELDLVEWEEGEEAEQTLVEEQKEFQWNAIAICEVLAAKKNYRLAGGGRPDIYKAAQEILRDVVCGQTPVYFEPPLDTKAAAVDQ